ncbi:MAG: thiosulfate oxidation carrier protein SoxY [Rhodospirillales bacterium]|nr:thiosulfate oxidation carrier protein SoxY [Rhodospirillales bacterium]
MQSQKNKIQVSRRDILNYTSAGILAAAGISLFGSIVKADKKMTVHAVSKLAGGKEIMSGKITLELPQIAENGNTVPLSVEVDSPMTDADYVKSVHIFAEGNPEPSVASFHFTPASGVAKASVRMRLAKTQNVVAVAEMSNGSIFQATTEVKVTIGGCGG